MKYITPIILAASLVFSFPAKSQTNTPPATPETTFFNSVASFFTSFNTNLPSVSTAQIWTGTANIKNQTMQAELGASLHPSALAGFGFDAVIRNDVALGSVASAQGGVSYHVTYVDVDLAPYIHYGYDWKAVQGYVAPGLRVFKMMTPNTYSGVSLELPILLKDQGTLVPTYCLSIGFKL